MICDNCKIKDVCKLVYFINVLQQNGEVQYTNCKIKNDIQQTKILEMPQKRALRNEKNLTTLKKEREKPKKLVKCENCKEQTYEDEISVCSKCGKKICSACGTTDMNTKKIMCEDCWEKE